MADNSEMQIEYNLFADVWKLLKNNYNPSSVKEYWNNLIMAAHEIEAKYKSDLCNDLLLLVVAELERRYNNQNSINGGGLSIDNK